MVAERCMRRKMFSERVSKAIYIMRSRRLLRGSDHVAIFSFDCYRAGVARHIEFAVFGRPKYVALWLDSIKPSALHFYVDDSVYVLSAAMNLLGDFL